MMTSRGFKSGRKATSAELRDTANTLLGIALRGQDSFTARMVVADVIHPLLNLMDEMEAQKGLRWLTLEEAMDASSRTKNFFEKPLVSLGGRSRLAHWKGEGLADQTKTGMWLISPIAVPKSDSADEDVNATEGSDQEGELHRILNNFGRKS